MRRSIRILVALLSLSLGVAIAGASALANSNATPDVTIRYSQAGSSLTFANTLYGQAAGYFKKQGLNIENQAFIGNPAQVLNLLLTGDADIVTVSPPAIYQATAANRGIVDVAMAGKGTTHDLALTNDVVKRLAAKGVTPKSPLKQRVAALKGLSIGTLAPGSSVYQELDYALGQAGLSTKDVNVSFTSDYPALVAAARAGRVDGFTAPVPDVLVGSAEGWSTIWLRTNDFPVFGLANQVDVVTTREFAAEHPEAVQAFLRGLYQAQLDFRRNPAKVERILKNSEWFKDTDAQLFHLAFAETLPLYAKVGFTPYQRSFKARLALYNASAPDNPAKVTFEQVYPLTWRKFDAQLFKAKAWTNAKKQK